MKKNQSSTRCGVLAGGNWTVDQIKIIDVYPERDQLANILGQWEGGGGSPHNVLMDLARLGAPFPLMAAGLVGRDDLGRGILEDCRRHGIDTRHLHSTPQAPTSHTFVMSEEGGGHRTFFHHRGANALWDGAGLDFKKTRARIFHLGYLLLLDALDAPDARHGTKAAALLRQARVAGVKTSMDVVSEDSDRFARVVLPALRHADYCFLNEIEAGKTTGFTIREADGALNTTSLRHAAGALMQGGAMELIVVHFAEGCFARSREGGDFWQASVKVPAKHIAGAAGAGDALAAGVLLGLHEGWGLQKCLLTGTCAAAASLSHPTCAGGVPSLPAAMKLARRFGLRPSLKPL